MEAQSIPLLVSKIAPLFFYPLGIVLILLLVAVAAIARSWQRVSLGLIAAAFSLLWIASLPVTADALMGELEKIYTPMSVEETPSAKWAIVLGGALSGDMPPRKSIDLGDAADRVLLASRLFRAQTVERILVSGGALPWGPKAAPEAEAMRGLLIEWGVEAGRVQIEAKSRNTYENAVFSREVLSGDAGSPILLITSAFHMPRAVAVFRRAGFQVIPAPTDVQVVHKPEWVILDFLPDAGALQKTTVAVKEFMGIAAYRWRNYL